MNFKRNIKNSLIILFLSFTLGLADENISTNLQNQTKNLEYLVSAKNDESTVILELNSKEKTEGKIEIKYSSRFIKINEHYKSIIDTNNFRTINFFASRTNRFFGRLSNRYAFSNFYTNRIETTEGGRTNIYFLKDTNTLKSIDGWPVLLDPMSIHYFLSKYNISNLNNQSILCSDGKEPWIYTFEVKSYKNGYYLNVKTKKRNASFNCCIVSGKVEEINYKAGGIVPIKLTLKK